MQNTARGWPISRLAHLAVLWSISSPSLLELVHYNNMACHCAPRQLQKTKALGFFN